MAITFSIHSLPALFSRIKYKFSGQTLQILDIDVVSSLRMSRQVTDNRQEPSIQKMSQADIDQSSLYIILSITINSTNQCEDANSNTYIPHFDSFVSRS